MFASKIKKDIKGLQIVQVLKRFRYFRNTFYKTLVKITFALNKKLFSFPKKDLITLGART
jgi:hypothetical protein